MPFMVIYSTSDGASCHEQADAIDEAALFVERLRNQEGIEEIRIYRMEEISFAFRPYYKVELGLPERSGATPPPPVMGTVPAPPADEPVTVDEPDGPEARALPLATSARIEPAVVPPTSIEGAAVDANGRRGLFGR